MLDIKVIRENPERVKAAVKSRNGNLDAEVDELIAIDQERRKLQQENDSLKQQQNEASKQIPQIKKAGGDASEILAKMTEIKAEVKANDDKLAELAARRTFRTRPSRSAKMTPKTLRSAAGASRKTSASNRKPTGTSAPTSASSTRRPRRKSPAPASISTEAPAPDSSAPSSTTT